MKRVFINLLKPTINFLKPSYHPTTSFQYSLGVCPIAFLKKVFDIDANYILDYHVPADDLDDINAYTNKSKDRVLEKYDEDIKLINFDLTSYI